MERLRLYVETSVWSHWFADDTPERRDETRELFKRCTKEAEKVRLYVSRFVVGELSAAPVPRGSELLALVERFGAMEVEEKPEAEELAIAYLQHGALPPTSVFDAMHAALATALSLDALVSWDCRHLANLTRRHKINQVNAEMGYAGNLEILTPMECSSMPISKVQREVWRIRDKLQRKFLAMSEQERREYLDSIPQRAEKALGRPLKLRREVPSRTATKSASGAER
jgi:predicted nucleic acid-binding protein